MATYHEGHGFTVVFGTSGYSAEVKSLTNPSRVREAIETTHQGSTTKDFVPGKTVDLGELQLTCKYDPAQPDIIDDDPETITVTYPLLSGESTAANIAYTGFVTNQGGSELSTDSEPTETLTIKITAFTFTAAT